MVTGFDFESQKIEKAKLECLIQIVAELKTLNETMATINTNYEIIHNAELDP